MGARVLLLLFVLGVLAPRLSQAGVRLARVGSEDNDKQFRCHDGSRSIAPHHVGDALCHCEDGSDELDSGHCEHQRFMCGSGAENRLIFQSRVDDGVCDCCDGSDERAGVCPNTCGAHAATHTHVPDLSDIARAMRVRGSSGRSGGAAGALQPDETPARLFSSAERALERLRDDTELPSSGLDDGSQDDLPTVEDDNAALIHAVSDEQVQLVTAQNPTVINGDEELGAVLEANNHDNDIPTFVSAEEVTDPAAKEALKSGPGYYQQPAVYKDTVVFVSEDDLWSVPLTGGPHRPTRLTSGIGQVWRPRISSRGKWIAYSASEEGSPDVYVMPLEGGRARRLTYLGDAMVVGWSLDDTHVVFVTYSSHFHDGQNEELFRVSLQGGQPEPLGVGWSSYISYGPPMACDHCVIPHHKCTHERAALEAQAKAQQHKKAKEAGDKDGGEEGDEGDEGEGEEGEGQGPDLEKVANPCAELCQSRPDQCVFDNSYEGYQPSVDYTGRGMTTTSVLGRHAHDISTWKRYRGGQRGKLWLDLDGAKQYEPLVDLPGNIGLFAWVWNYVVFATDSHCDKTPTAEDPCVSNLVLVEVHPEGADTPEKRTEVRTQQAKENFVTEFTDHYVRNPVASLALTDDRKVPVVFSKGADLWYVLIDEHGQASDPEMVQIDWTSPQQQKQRRFLPAAPQVTHYALSPDAAQVAYLARGRPFVQTALEDGPPLQLGVANGVRYTQLDFLHTGDLVAVSDEQGEAAIEVLKTKGVASLQSEPVMGGRTPSVGRVESLVSSPTDPYVAFTNHQYQLTVLDISSGNVLCSLQSYYDGGIDDVVWSPDGAWLAFTFFAAPEVSVIKLMRIKDDNTSKRAKPEVCGLVDVTSPLVRDHSPSWDPEGNFLYFLSTRDFDPVPDEIIARSMGFVGASRPFLVTLNAAATTPFQEGKWTPDDVRAIIHRLKTSGADTSKVHIDVENLKDRIVGFPVPSGTYLAVLGVPGRRVLYIRHPIEEDLSAGYVLLAFDFITQREDVLGTSVVGLSLSHDGQQLGLSLLGAPSPVCILPAAYRGALTGSLLKCPDTSRVQMEVIPPLEWRQVLDETWRRARDNFWTGSMMGLDWDAVRTRYLDLVSRVGTRSELSDLQMQLQGELGTSHAYIQGQKHRPGNYVNVGKLGCDVVWDDAYGGFQITTLFKGDLWSTWSGPLARPGMNIEEGDVIQKINGRNVVKTMSLDEHLLGKAGTEVEITILKFARQPVKTRHPSATPPLARIPQFPVTIVTEPLPTEGPLRYRDWVNNNRRYVDRISRGRVGYIHVPDMVREGFAEFSRAFLTQASRDALIVDVRYNSGGFISDNLLDKLSRKTLGYVKSRWGGPAPYPHYSSPGPKVALINEGCASDCDIFSENFCRRVNFAVPCLDDNVSIEDHCMLVGERTWGGVVGIDWKGRMADFSGTSQPEYSHWFQVEGWSVENTGVHPTKEVLYKPQHFADMYEDGVYEDPQLRAALDEIAALMGREEYTKSREQCVPDLTLGERA